MPEKFVLQQNRPCIYTDEKLQWNQLFHAIENYNQVNEIQS